MERYKQKQRKKRQRQYVIIAAIAVIVIVIVAYVVSSQPPSYPAQTPSSLSDVPTIGNVNPVEHYHVHLDIYINGTAYQVPANLGHVSDDSIYYALHTHDTSGIIHIEAPSVRTFTLGQIFEVYGWPLDSNHIFDRTGFVTMYVNNGVTPRQFDTGYILHSGDDIALVFGAPPAAIPSSYNWQFTPCISNCN